MPFSPDVGFNGSKTKPYIRVVT